MTDINPLDMEKIASSSQEIDLTSVKSLLNLVTGALSLLASIWIFHFYSKSSSPRPVSFRLILALSIADFFFSLSNIISVFDVNLPDLCTAEAIIRASSVMSGLYWASCIAILTYQTFDKGRNFDQQTFFRKTLILGCTGPIIISIIPFFTDGYYWYGVQTFGCYITIKNSAHATHFAKFVLIMIFDGIPVLIALSITLIVYVRVAKKYNDLSESLLLSTNVEIRRLFWYPAVLFLAYIPSLIDNIIEIYIASASESHVFTVVHILLTHSVGFTNGLVYGLQRKKYYDVEEKSNRERNISTDQTGDLNDDDDRNCNPDGTSGDEYSEYSDEERSPRPRGPSDYEELMQARSAHLL